MVIVVLNGLLGNRKKELDVSELVAAAMKRLPDTHGVKVIRGRGGSGAWRFNKIYKQLERHSKKDEVLCLVGKSYGAHWCVRLLWKLADREKLCGFRAVAMVTVDPSFVLHRMQRKIKTIPRINWARNFHQYGPRSGYLLGPPAENVVVKAKHSNAERDPKVRRAIEDLLMWGRVKSRRR